MRLLLRSAGWALATAVLAQASPLGAQCDLVRVDPPAGRGGWYGGSASVSGDRMYVGALHADTYGADSGDAFIYRFDIGTWSLESQLLAPGIAAGDWFGWDGDIDGDCAVVGAGEPGSGPGYAWTFRRLGTTWVPEQRLTGTGTGINDQFGATLDLDGDRLIINSLAGPIGGAYVFERGPSGWSEVALLVPPGPAGGDSVAGVAISVRGRGI